MRYGRRNLTTKYTINAKGYMSCGKANKVGNKATAQDRGYTNETRITQKEEEQKL